MRYFKFFLLLVIIFLSISYGILIERKNLFPYFYVIRVSDEVVDTLRNIDLIMNLYRLIKKPNLDQESESTKVKKLNILENIEFSIIPRKKIETTLLPVYTKGYKYENLAISGGAIESYQNNIIISDKYGRFIRHEPIDTNNFDLNYPTLPMNISDFFNYGDYGKHAHFGVKDLLIIPNEKNLSLYVSHHLYDKRLNNIHFAVSQLYLDKENLNSLSEWKIIFKTSALPTAEIFGGLGSGGRMIENDSKIILTIGDYNHDNMIITSSDRMIAQNSKNEFGSIISINLESEKYETLSIGHRNPQGLVKRFNGDIYSTEHGPRGGDELNIINDNENYGWPKVSYGMDYDYYTLADESIQGTHSNFKKPVYAWLPSIGISNLIEIQNFHPRWNNDLLVSSLKTMSIYRMRIEDRNIKYSEPIFIGSRIRDIKKIKDGSIVLWTDSSEIIYINVEKNLLLANRFGGAGSYKSVLGKCVSCHHFKSKSNQDDYAPTLRGILGKKFASDNGFEYYSDHIKSINGKWTEETMKKFLIDPYSVIPGTTMGVSPIDKESDIEVLLEELKNIY